MTHNLFESGVQVGEWKLALLQRHDYFINSSDDLSWLYYSKKHKHPLEEGRNLNLSLDAIHYAGDGLHLGHRFVLDENLSITLGGTFFKADSVRRARLRGTAETLNEQDYNFSFQLDEYYGERNLLGQTTRSRPQGKGYWVDLGFQWSPVPGWSSQLELRDLLGRVHWDSVHYTHADAHSKDQSNKSYDEDGYVRYLPVLSGRDETRDWVQRLKPLGKLSLELEINNRLQAVTTLQQTPYKDFYDFGFRYQHTPDQHYEFRVDPENSVITLGADMGWGQLSIGLDERDSNHIRTIKIGTQINVHF